ncbi:hypothetical protein U1E44_02815 [Arenibacter sp. GZD96]|uniref:hypothetical protein n=1 Tax=Aurantibrevibacter litoralis TaxID=3106030 RepID=UPI002B000EE1|nr:hypothetical protein [Arenibacter sp. GZD-96]MEA1785012.1 hypothetical protein [Arenibacter sp. GZD-96]
MKTILTFFFILFIGVAAQAQNATPEVKVETSTMGIKTSTNEVSDENENSVARLYRFKNAQVKKALSFTTKNNRPKLA